MFPKNRSMRAQPVHPWPIHLDTRSLSSHTRKERPYGRQTCLTYEQSSLLAVNIIILLLLLRRASH